MLGGERDQAVDVLRGGMAAFSVISACYTNIAISVTFNRDAGILKRVRGTPLPGWCTSWGGSSTRSSWRSCW